MLDGKEIDHLPAGEGAQARVEPIYETIEGWKEPTANARSWADLPAQAIKYVRRVEELVGCPDRLAFHQPGTRGYYPGSKPVRGLTGCYRKARIVELIWLITTR